MKIEMGESLFYSWLRHVKECQIVQTNWKVSPQWALQNEDELQRLYNVFASAFDKQGGVFKQNSSLGQFLRQAECDVLGMSINNGIPEYHAVDVAFHENGLNYGDKEVTALKVAAKCIRTAMCLYGYMNTRCAEIVFASPKIHNGQLALLEPYVTQINRIFFSEGYSFHVRLICNEDFHKTVLEPILLISGDVADTSELFLRGFQMYSMFADQTVSDKTGAQKPNSKESSSNADDMSIAYRELKIGKLANTVLRGILQAGRIPSDELNLMQDKEYSKRVFDLQYPALVKAGDEYESSRYYSNPVVVQGERYYLCSQWFETPANNDRPYLEKWIAQHQ